MSATSELLLEQIKKVEDALVKARAMGQDPTPLEDELRGLRERLAAASQALTENKQLLKG